ncbi:4Fe-4S binding protein [Thermococcus peptonophilus]|uniref:4Fe-4S binding protein n=1 Tax=Thermococcus peptonophilus TaxID=53952 RepID=UPI0034672DE1
MRGRSLRTSLPDGSNPHAGGGIRIVDDEKCIRCKMCTLVCPIGGVLYDYINHQMIRCDLCGGDPPSASNTVQ